MSSVVADIRSVVKDCLERASDRREAIALLQREAERDPEVRSQLVETYMPSVLQQICAQAISKEERDARNSTGHSAVVDREVLLGAVRLVSRIKLWVLEGSGIKLLAATREDVEAAIAWHNTQVAGHERDIAFYSAIVAKLKKGQSVASRFSEDQLAEFLAVRA